MEELFFHKPTERSLRDKEKAMDAKEVVTRLIRGSHNIDRMRKEIKEIVSIIMGCVRPHLPVNFYVGGEQFEFKFLSSSGVSWWGFANRGPGNYEYQVYCSFETGNEKLKVYIMVSGRVLDEVAAVNVQRVYDSLDVFVEGILKQLPSLQNEMKPLIDASFVTFGT